VSISEAVERATAYLAEHPDEAVYRDSAATAHLESGLVVNVTGPGGERLATDMPTGIGGTATMPSPGWFLRAATASCVASLIAIRAAVEGIAIRSIDVVADSESDDRGILGIDPGIPAGPLSSRVSIAVDAPGAEREAVAALISWAVEHCPVTDGIRRAIPLEVEVRS
jgi:uncharacterized OsmC-like protein